MVEIEMYSTAICPYCVRARRLLKKKGVEFTEIRIDQEPAREAEMIQRSQRFTVPQIFIGERHIGGYDDMVELDMDEQLDPLLQGANLA
jgi:glutaredoxin 3